jgi:5'-3' exonuclease
MTSEKMILIDGDSIAYMAGIGETEQDVRNVVDEYMQRILNQTWNGSYELYVEADGDGKNIFRNHVAMTKPYKGNRATTERPPNLGYAKTYMQTKYGAEIQTYLESEDVVAMRAYDHGLENVIIASIDKDMLQIPTEFYNYTKDTLVRLGEDEAMYNFWKQVLMGDATDNIPGLYRVGPKKAEAMLKHVGSLGSNSIEKAYVMTVAAEYIKRDHPYQYLVEQCRLLRMLRSKTEVYLPPISKEDYETLEKTEVF